MNRKFIAVFLFCCALAAIVLHAGAAVLARGPGNSRGLGASTSSGFSGGGGAAVAPASPARAGSDAHINRSANAAWPDANPRYGAPFESRGPSQQQINEARIYEHRFDQAQRLRTISERNGNAHLLDTADRMESQANQHYNRRMERIDPLAASPGVTPTEPVAADSPQIGADARPPETPGKQTSRRRWRWWPFQ